MFVIQLDNHRVSGNKYLAKEDLGCFEEQESNRISNPCLNERRNKYT